MDELARLSPKQAEVVKLRFSAGLSLQEIAELHGHSEKTTQRDWNHAKAWLVDRLQSNR